MRFDFRAVSSALFLFAAVCAFAGCAHRYVMTLNNGARVTTAGKPRLENGVYYFKDTQGRPGRMPAGRVRELAPASLVKDENTQFKVPQAK